VSSVVSLPGRGARGGTGSKPTPAGRPSGQSPGRAGPAAL